MGVKEYLVDLDENNRLRYHIVTGQGGVEAFLVQYETRMDDEYVPVVRYDTRHGRAHRDVLDRRGNNIAKTWLPGAVSYSEALQSADRDLRAHWPVYRARFIALTGEKEP